MIDANHPLAKASRIGDEEADSGRELPGILGDLGLDADDVRYVAQQRALRAVLLNAGRFAELSLGGKTPTPIKVSAEEQREEARLTAIYIDAISIGWRACQIDQE